MMRQAGSYGFSTALHALGLALLAWAPGRYIPESPVETGGPPPGWIAQQRVDSQFELRELAKLTVPKSAAFQVVQTSESATSVSQPAAVTPVRNPTSPRQPEVLPVRPDVIPIVPLIDVSAPVGQNIAAKADRLEVTPSEKLPDGLPPKEGRAEKIKRSESQPAKTAVEKPVEAPKLQTEKSSKLELVPSKQPKPLAKSDTSPTETTSGPRSKPQTASQAGSDNLKRGVDQYPRTLPGNAPPEYPTDALQLGRQGVAVLLVIVAENGRPMQIRLVKSSGFKSLDKAAKAAVAKWKFRPAQRGGRAVSCPIKVPVRFRIATE